MWAARSRCSRLAFRLAIDSASLGLGRARLLRGVRTAAANYSANTDHCQNRQNKPRANHETILLQIVATTDFRILVSPQLRCKQQDAATGVPPVKAYR